MDEYLERNGFYRKNIALDGSCLFRAAADYLLPANPTKGHLIIRRQVCDYLRAHKEEYKDRLITPEFEEYVENLSGPTSWASVLELDVISKLYNINFLVFLHPGPPLKVTKNSSDEEVLLSVTHDHYYEIVYPKTHVNNLAFCQSIVYKILYEQVFGLKDIDYAVHKMLHDKEAKSVREKLIQDHGNCSELLLFTEKPGEVVDLKKVVDSGAILFPYKVAKALDPDIYRNINFDVWVESTRGKPWSEFQRYLYPVSRRSSFWMSTLGPLRVNGRCHVRCDGRVLNAIILDITPDKSTALIFLDELVEKRVVPCSDLIPIPRSIIKSLRGQQTSINVQKANRKLRYHDESEQGDETLCQEEQTSNFCEEQVTTAAADSTSLQRSLVITPDGEAKYVYRYVAPSVLEDCSDLPLYDPPTVQFFFNLGIEYFHRGMYLVKKPAEESSVDSGCTSFSSPLNDTSGSNVETSSPVMSMEPSPTFIPPPFMGGYPVAINSGYDFIPPVVNYSPVVEPAVFEAPVQLPPPAIMPSMTVPPPPVVEPAVFEAPVQLLPPGVMPSMNVPPPPVVHSSPVVEPVVFEAPVQLPPPVVMNSMTVPPPPVMNDSLEETRPQTPTSTNAEALLPDTPHRPKERRGKFIKPPRFQRLKASNTHGTGISEADPTTEKPSDFPIMMSQPNLSQAIYNYDQNVCGCPFGDVSFCYTPPVYSEFSPEASGLLSTVIYQPQGVFYYQIPPQQVYYQ